MGTESSLAYYECTSKHRKKEQGCVSPYNQSITAIGQETQHPCGVIPHNQAQVLPPNETVLSAVEASNHLISAGSHNQSLGPVIQDSSTALSHNQSLGPVVQDSSTALSHNQSFSPVVQDSSTALSHNRSLGPVVQDSSTVLSHNQSLGSVVQDSSTALSHNRSLGPEVQNSLTVLSHNQSLGPVVQDSSTILPHHQSLDLAVQISPVIEQRTEASTFTTPVMQEKQTMQGKQKQDQSTQERKDRSVLPEKKGMRRRQQHIQGDKTLH